MKRIIVILLALFGTVVSSYACGITFTLQNEKGEIVHSEKVKVGENYILLINFKPTHRSCIIDIKDTKFKMDGIKVYGATDWEKIGDGAYVRKLKITIVENNKPEVKLILIRDCDRGGIVTELVLKK